MGDMLWGATLRSRHPHARIRSVSIGEALATDGVFAVLTCDDVPGQNAHGLEHADQPVLAADVVRYAGEPVALVAADHPEVARVAASKIVVDYEVLDPVTDAVAALEADAPRLHPGGNLVRHLKIRKGDPEPRADVVVTGTYEIGMQDQAFLGPEAGAPRVRRREGRDDGGRSLRRADGPYRRLGRLHQHPAVGGDARVRVGAGRFRLRGADGQGRRGPQDGPGRGPPPQRDGTGQRRP